MKTADVFFFFFSKSSTGNFFDSELCKRSTVETPAICSYVYQDWLLGTLNLFYKSPVGKYFFKANRTKEQPPKALL